MNSTIVEPIEYRFCRVVFGVNCSPFLLNATLLLYLDSYAHDDPEFVRKLKNSFYVDDLVSGEQVDEEALVLYSKATERLSEGGFKLRKWLSNSASLRTLINERESISDETPREEKRKAGDSQTYAKATLGTQGEGSLQKVLGIPWNCESHTFHFNLGQVAGRG